MRFGFVQLCKHCSRLNELNSVLCMKSFHWVRARQQDSGSTSFKSSYPVGRCLRLKLTKPRPVILLLHELPQRSISLYER